jgi:Rha family phage regulatory protein
MNDMKNLVIIQDGQPVTSSLLVAQKFGKEHKSVMRAIEAVIEQTPENECKRNFALTSQDVEMPNGGFRQEPLYVMTKDGFSAVVLGFTGKQAIKFRWDFIAEFNQMERTLQSGTALRVAAVEENIKRRYLLTKELQDVNTKINELMRRHKSITKEMREIDNEDFAQLSLFPRFGEFKGIAGGFPNKRGAL